jgi:alkanesulfonate monooxygenase SsuD/methylene tetrahydromethanopterin reductase-like flavin-dependent oxidoreductase (luciferase family)
MRVAITIESWMGLTWSLWKEMVPELESMGFAGIFRCDHFPMGVPAATASLELITSLTYLAEHTRKVDFGSLVAPLSVRDPVMLARQAMSLNDLSGGRMVLGVGSGWQEVEHTVFGYNLGDTKTRFDRLAEGLEVITSLVRDELPVNFEGHFYKLQNARLLPRPQQPTRILVGGNGPKRTLPLVARYADLWNCQVASAETFRERSTQLDQLILDSGRQPSDVKRTVMIPVYVWRTQQEFDRMMELLRNIPLTANVTAEEFTGWIASMNGLMGTPDQVVEHMQAYADAGADLLVVQWLNLNDWAGLEMLAREVLPHFA